MKIQFPISNCQLPIEKSRAPEAFAHWQSAIGNRQSQKGVALVITLILLSVTLIMAVAFLAISRRERNAVATTTDTASARLAADAALAGAEAQIVANLFATNNGAYNFGLLVSTNFFNTALYNPTAGANPTNINYDSANLAGQPDERNQALANLFYSARVPVYMTNYVLQTMENRFYLDLNRNGEDDPNGPQPVISPDPATPYYDTNGNETATFNPPDVLSNTVIGDPEWIGLLDHPDAAHGPNNRFVSRYAFIAVPVGNTLDLNAIHNQVFDEPTAPLPGAISVNPGANTTDGFFRNEGVGSWEINLAAFLADLNTNEWGQVIGFGGQPPLSANYYQYNEPLNPNAGAAFDDARALLAYRYFNNYNSLSSVLGLYNAGLGMAGPGPVAFLNDNIDGYTRGPLMTGFKLPLENDNPQLPWAGAYNTNQFFTIEELYNTNETEINVTPPGFSDRLLAAGTNVSTYSRYTFYRLLEQLGSDSTPDSGKINLNYSNAVVNYGYDALSGALYPTNVAVVPGAATNFVPWSATNFFLAAADRLLRLYTTNWFQFNPSNYLATFYGVATNYYYSYYSNTFLVIITNDPTGLGMTNIPLFGMTNQIPAFGVGNIPVVINSNFVYSPAVNRLLQLAANIYDSVYYTSNYTTLGGLAYLPTVFRPIFNVTNELNFKGAFAKDVYICGYSELIERVDVPEPDVPLSVPWDLRNPTVFGNLAYGIHSGPLGVNGAINVFGVPMIIGAKKGFPNFNEFYMESAFQLTRKLMVTRQSTNLGTIPPSAQSSFWGYNEMFNLDLTNSFAVECWNSYRSNYMRPTTMYVTNYLVMTLTNDVMYGGQPFSFSTNLVAGGVLGLGVIPIANFPWPGYTNVYPYSVLSGGSFQIPLMTNFAAAPVSTFRFNTPGDVEEPGHSGPYLTTNVNLPYEVNVAAAGYGRLPQPHWGVVVTNNLQVAVVDFFTGRLIDYVQLSGPYSIRDLTSEVMNGYDTVNGGNNTGYNDLWDTNLINGVPIGFFNQYSISQGNGTPIWSSALWSSDEQTAYDQMNAFRAFTMGPNALQLTFPGYVPHPGEIAAALMTNAIQMAYTPTATVVQDIDWQVNDPLVHYMASDLVNPATSVFINSPFTWYNNYTYADNFATQPGSGFQTTVNWPGNLGKGRVNQRYQPWGGNPTSGAGTNLLAIKDPLVTCSDDWNFPTNKFPTVGWLGRVHRGTPWQTVYLKASDILGNQSYFGNYGANGPNLWVDWTGNVNPFDVTNTAPKADRLLFDVFTTAFNDNASRGTLSVNVGAAPGQSSLAAWSALFSGVTVLSNNAVNPPLGQTASSMTAYTNVPISPAGPGTASAMYQLWRGIAQTRAAVSNYDGVTGVFEHAGDILVVPQLTEQSPFLNWNNSAQQRSGISDEMYEWLPQQVMSLLREGSPRYVVYCYGQALKPAPNSLVTSGGNFFGMCTNYQVVAESAARAVVRVDGAGTPAAHVVVESYNPLPPD